MQQPRDKKEDTKAKKRKKKKKIASKAEDDDIEPASAEPTSEYSSSMLPELLHNIKTGQKEIKKPEDIGKIVSGFINAHPTKNGKAITVAEGERIYQQYLNDGTIDNKYFHNSSNDGRQNGLTDVRSFEDDFEAFKSVQGTWQLYTDMQKTIQSSSGQLLGMILKHGSTPDAAFYERGVNQIKGMRARLKNAQMKSEEIFGEDTEIGKELLDGINQWEENWITASRVHLEESSTDTLRSLRESVSGKSSKFDAQIELVKNWDNKVTTLENRLAAFKESRTQISSTSTEHQAADKKAVES